MIKVIKPGQKVLVKYKGEVQAALAIDFAGVCIRKGEPSVIIKENDGCIPLSQCEMYITIIEDEKGEG